MIDLFVFISVMVRTAHLKHPTLNGVYLRHNLRQLTSVIHPWLNGFLVHG
jgi:hypothetical protein